jgi:hypothetical protein
MHNVNSSLLASQHTRKAGMSAMGGNSSYPLTYDSSTATSDGTLMCSGVGTFGQRIGPEAAIKRLMTAADSVCSGALLPDDAKTKADQGNLGTRTVRTRRVSPAHS